MKTAEKGFFGKLSDSFVCFRRLSVYDSGYKEMINKVLQNGFQFIVANSPTNYKFTLQLSVPCFEGEY